MELSIQSISNKPYLVLDNKKINLTDGFGMYSAIKELKGLNTGLDIRFDNFTQFGRLINKINKEVRNERRSCIINS